MTCLGCVFLFRQGEDKCFVPGFQLDVATQGLPVIVMALLSVIGLSELRKNREPQISTVSVLLPVNGVHRLRTLTKIVFARTLSHKT